LGVLVVLTLMIAYSAYFSAYSIQRHNAFRTHASDLGQMDQAAWNTLHGRFVADTKPDGRQGSRLTDHVEPIFLLVSLSYVFYDGVEAILVFQSIALALGALPIFWIARKKLQSEWAGVAFAAMYLLFPALQAANLAEFHAVTLAPAPLLFACHYAEERAWKRYALFSLLALAVKEEIALLVFALGVWAVATESRNTQYATRNPRVVRSAYSVSIPTVVALVSLAWFYVAVFVIVPQNNFAGQSPYVSRYPGASNSLLQSLNAIPPLIAGIFIREKMIYVLQLFASVGFLALLDPVSLLLGAPLLALNLLSSYPAQYSGTYHYSAPVVPYFVLAAIGGARRILDFGFQILDLRKFA
ncbi:MAG: DUF2079 domain-containing protein, partial [Chloroflexi bacterium]|nr:DUF2079 domain-containing protein [Chloroflexota bacterium]